MSPSGKPVRVVLRACVRAVWLLSGIGSEKWSPAFPLFPLWCTELALFSFGADELSLFPSPRPPNLLSNFSWAHRYYMIHIVPSISFPQQPFRSRGFLASRIVDIIFSCNKDHPWKERPNNTILFFKCGLPIPISFSIGFLCVPAGAVGKGSVNPRAKVKYWWG